MFVLDKTLIDVALRTLIIYLIVLFGIRLTGKREVGQMTPVDLVLLLLIANAVQNAMTGPDTSLTGGLVAAGTLLLVNAVMGRLTFSSKKMRKLVEGSPTVLIRNGHIEEKNLTNEKIASEELKQALREHGVADVSDVWLAVLEVDGSISVLRKDEMPTVSRPHHKIRFISRKTG